MYKAKQFIHHQNFSAMKNTIISAIIIVSMFLSTAHAFAADNESRKAKKQDTQSLQKLLKFSVTDFIGKEDLPAGRADFSEYPAKETPAKSSVKKAASSKPAGK